MNKSRTVPSGNGANKARSKKNARFNIGDEAPEIVMNDPLGNERKLSDLRGKVVLLDFWASWCGPCRRENPAVVRAYQEYQPKGFEVFSVSLDKDLNRWTAAIQQDQLEWPNHVCDLKGWSNAAARAYGVSSIPHAILIDQDGVIVATHLRGRALVAQLEELLP
jgi:thiol-disulfide isomerase/thioredoxin